MICKAGLLTGVWGIGQLNKVKLQSSWAAKLAKGVRKPNITINKAVQAIDNRGAVSTEKKKREISGGKAQNGSTCLGRAAGG